MNFLTEYLSLSDLLDSDLSSYEYFCSLPENIKQKIEMEDARSFSEMQAIVRQEKQKGFLF